MSRQQPPQQQQEPHNNNNTNAWAQGSGWGRVAADAPMKQRDQPQTSDVVPSNSSDTSTNDRNTNKNKNQTNASIVINGNKSGLNHHSKNNNSNPATINNIHSKKHKTVKPSLSTSNNNSSNKITKKKQKRSAANEPEPRPKPTQQPFVLLKPTDFPALQTPVHAPPSVYTKPVATKLDPSAPCFTAVSLSTTIPAASSNNSTPLNNPTNKSVNKPPKMSSSDPKPTAKVPTSQTQTSRKNASSSIAARTPNHPKNTKSTTTNTLIDVLPQGQEHALLRLMMQQGKLAVAQKGRQRIRPRRKKFSALKKKVLEERLRQWRMQRNPSSDDHPDETTTSTLLAVLGWLTADDDWSDDDEYHELCSNFQEMAEKMGPVQRVWIPRREDGPVYVQFQTPQAADDALHAWNGLSLGGTALEVMPLSLSNEEDDDKVHMTIASDEEEAWRKRCEQAFQEKQSSAMQIDTVHEIGLWNALTEDDLEDEECLEESVNDIRVLAISYGPLETLRIERDGTPRVVLVYTCNLQDAKRIAGQLNQVTLSGSQLLAKVLRENESSLESSGSGFIVILRNVLTTDDLEDEECLEESMGDVKELAKQFGIVEKVEANVEAQTISVHYTSAEEKEKALAGFHGMVIGGQTVSVSTVSRSDDAALGSNNDEGAVETMFSGDKRIPERFAECKRVPKIPNSGQPRHYSILSKNETVKPLLMEMLAELMRLQKRAVEDKNAKAKRRLVMGLREVARGIRAHKVRMVVMANNLDEYGALDEKLQEILDLARREEVPVFFEFSKRALGKAIGKTIKIAVIGIQNPDGANQQFKKLSGLAAPVPVLEP